MISGAHILLYSKDPEVDRKFMQEILHFPNVDAGGGWLIFKLPAAEVAIHPSEDAPDLLKSELYLMCDDLDSELAVLKARNVNCAPVTEERWGRLTSLTLPGGGQIGLYQPLHPTALALKAV